MFLKGNWTYKHFNKVKQGKNTIGFLYLLRETSLLHPKNMSFLYSNDQLIIKQS